MGSTSSKEHVGQQAEIRRIDSAGVTTPGRGLYPEEAKVISDDNAMDIDLSLPVSLPPPPQQLKPPPRPSSPKKDSIPMVFKWEHGGRNVCITGTFNGWSKQVRMHRSGNDFTYIANLTRGKHAYKYVVDDEWRFAPDQPTVADIEGNINNFVDVSDFLPLGEFDLDPKDDGDSMYGRFMPDIDDYTKEPPPLPPHLRHIILNKVGMTTMAE